MDSAMDFGVAMGCFMLVCALVWAHIGLESPKPIPYRSLRDQAADRAAGLR